MSPPHPTSSYIDLAVIFRPGILSHPSHEMLPHEHALSQRVLEFLIAHQDWFMLDTPAPNPALVSPPLPSINPASAPPHNNYTQYPNRGASPPPRLPGSGITFATHNRQGVSEDEAAAGGWMNPGVPVSDKEIQREQERIKMMRRRTTLDRGGMCSTFDQVFLIE